MKSRLLRSLMMAKSRLVAKAQRTGHAQQTTPTRARPRCFADVCSGYCALLGALMPLRCDPLVPLSGLLSPASKAEISSCQLQDFDGALRRGHEASSSCSCCRPRAPSPEDLGKSCPEGPDTWLFEGIRSQRSRKSHNGYDL